jgi:flagellar motility protein MotE (MotC chaperone)
MTRLVQIIALVSVAVAAVPLAAVADDEGGGLFGAKVERKREPLPWEIPAPGEEQCRPEEMAVLRELRDRSRGMDVREQALDLREEAAGQLEARLAEEIARIDAMRAALTELLDRANDSSDENVASLAKMVDSMRAKDAAAMLEGMDEEVVLQVLAGIKPKQAAKVLGAMPAAKSQRLGDRFTLVPDPRDGLTEEGQ